MPNNDISAYERNANQGLGLWESKVEKTYKRGLVVGKFYPPHRGHKYLIDYAAARCESLTVMVCGGRRIQNPQGSQRQLWLQEIHPNVNVILVDDSRVDEDDSVAWAEFTKQTLGYTPDAVFGSELYIYPWSRALGTEGVVVDLSRSKNDVSGTRVRENPYKMWDHLEPCVRSYYVKRICIVGAESTGKTTLARDLAEHYATTCVPEYGREYTLLRQAGGADLQKWTSDEFLHIAQEQVRREDEAARAANRILICDTDAMATGIWHQHFMNAERHPLVEALASMREYDMYILPDLNTPFQQDGIRDGDGTKRRIMWNEFYKKLSNGQTPFITPTGTPRERLNKAIAHIDLLPKRIGYHS
jgi:HTH-type transcriptional repressor of NAD biosynthesis genes